MAKLNARRDGVEAFEEVRETFGQKAVDGSGVEASCCVAGAGEMESEWTDLALFLFSSICWGHPSQPERNE